MTKDRVNFRLGPAEKADARAALVLLADSGLSLTEAARRALMAREARGIPAKKTPLSEAIRGFMADRLKRNRRGATLDFYEQQFGKFAEAPFAERWQAVGRPELKQWLEGLKGFTARSMVFRAVRALYRWAAAQNPPLVTAIPTTGLTIDDQGGDRKTVGFYSVEVCELALQRVSDRARPALVCHLFAGIRPEEIAPRSPGKGRLSWECFDFEAKILRLPGEVAKTRRARLIEDLPAPLWEWLAEVPEKQRVGPLWSGTEGAWRGHMRAAVKGTKWVPDGFRHTFATMMLALKKEAGPVGEWLGHEGKPGTLRNKYVGLERRANAEKFVALRPPKKKPPAVEPEAVGTVQNLNGG